MIGARIQFHDAHPPAMIFTRGDIICYFNLGNEEMLLPLPYGEPKAMEGHGLNFRVTENSLILPAFGGAFFETEVH